MNFLSMIFFCVCFKSVQKANLKEFDLEKVAKHFAFFQLQIQQRRNNANTMVIVNMMG